MSKMSTQSITFREETEIVERLDADAKRRGMDRSDVIREALREKYPKVEEKA